MIKLKLHNLNFFAKRIVMVLLFFSLSNAVIGQNIPVPENIQAALLSKVLKFNSNYSKASTIKMLVVYDENSQINKNEFINGLDKSIKVKAINSSELKGNIYGYDVVYFMSGLYKEAAMCKTYGLLSVTGTSKYVEEGKISLGFEVENNKPKIILNLTSLDKENQSFSLDILRISKVFK